MMVNDYQVALVFKRGVSPVADTNTYWLGWNERQSYTILHNHFVSPLRTEYIVADEDLQTIACDRSKRQ